MGLKLLRLDILSFTEVNGTVKIDRRIKFEL